jgi:hypothetical protein
MTPPGPDRWIVHFTHVENLRSIVTDGTLTCDRQARQGRIQVEVGDAGIKLTRRNRTVPVDPGGCVGDYVPFYFAPRSPMMYRIACDHRDGVDGRYPDGDRPLAYLATTVGAIVGAELPWVVTDGNAATATTRFGTTLHDLQTMVDWPLMREKVWRNTPDDPDRQRRRMAEFLVHGAVPLTLIRQVAGYSEEHVGRIRAGLAGHALAAGILVRPAWYYGYGRR